MSATSTFNMIPGPGPTPAHAKPYRAADIVRIRPHGRARLPVAEATDEPLPSRSRGLLGAALAACRRRILIWQAEHTLRALSDDQLRDIGLSRDQIQPPLLAVLAANRHLWRW